MHNVTVISFDAKREQRCSRKLAQQLLHHGLATIVKFYPYTLRLKGKPFNPNDPFAEEAQGPSHPQLNPPASKRLKLFSEDVI